MSLLLLWFRCRQWEIFTAVFRHDSPRFRKYRMCPIMFISYKYFLNIDCVFKYPPNIVQKTLMFPSLHRNLVTRAAPHSYVMFALGRKHGVTLNSYNILSSHTVNQYIYIGHLVSLDTLSCTVPPPRDKKGWTSTI